MSKSDEVAIKVEGVNKTFKLPHEKQNSIKGLFVSMFRGKRTYERQHVLKDTSFEIKKGEFFGIIGRNGSGKSTLLKLLAGIYSPDSGYIRVNGKLTPFIELGVGFNPELTGRENVFLNGALLGFNRKEMESMYNEIVEFAELEKFMDQKLKNYSSGMQVRLAFSIAIRAKSDILLIDEVLAVGDIVFQQKCYKFFDSIKGAGQTVVFISHDGAAIERFCDRVILINRGRIQKTGSPKAVMTHYMNIINRERIANENAIRRNAHDVGEVSVKDVNVTNKSGKKATKLDSNQPFDVTIDYEANRPISDVVAGIDIINSKGCSVLGPNTREENHFIDLTKKGAIRVSFPGLPLSPDEYSITVGFFNKDETYSYALVENAARLNIEGKPRHGVIHVQPVWKEL